MEYKKIPDLIKSYGKNSLPIPLSNYKEAITTVYSKIYNSPKNLQAAVEEQIEASRITSTETFYSKSKNAFLHSIDTKNVVKKKNCR